MNLGDLGPLDYAANADSRKTTNIHQMEKISNKINGYSEEIARKERELEQLNQAAMK